MGLSAPFFSSRNINRMSALRTDAQGLAKLIHDPAAVFIAIRSGDALTINDQAALLSISEVISRAELQRTLCIDNFIYLGFDKSHHLFAFDADRTPGFSDPVGHTYITGRDLLTTLDHEAAALLAYARAMIHWQNSQQFCGHCGNKNKSTEGGFVMACSHCGQRSFPRLDPAIITLVHNQNRCLLGRQISWPEQRYSTVAGFVEPGESLEDALRREVQEETNIIVGECQYLASQPWPFPAALMIGFHAEGLSTQIALNDNELADAAWFSREQLRSGEIILPPQQSIAFQLIAEWHDLDSEERLADIPPSDSFNAPSA